MSAAIQALPAEDENVVVLRMLTISHAVDLYLGDLQRRGYSRRTADTYRRILDKFTDHQPGHYDVTDLTPDDCRRFLDGWNQRKQGTRAHVYAVLNSFLEWLYRQDRIRRNPLDKVPRPRRIPAEDLDVVTVDVREVQRMLKAGVTWTEKLAVAIPAYLGPRRHAAALLRLRDYDRDRRRIRFREKGGKTIWKPVPVELADLIDAAIADGKIVEPADYLIPPEGTLVLKGDRDDRVIWRVVSRVATRAGVEAHVHALRAAFATYYLEQNPGDVEALQALMGHRSIATTQVYLRKLDRQAAMERVRGLSWTGNSEAPGSPQTAGERFEASQLVGAGGFEPPFSEAADGEPSDSEPRELDLVEALLERTREATPAAEEARR